MNQDNVLEVNNLHVQFNVRKGMVQAVNGVSFVVPRGKTVGIIGESGSGKSVTARAIMRLLARNGRIPQGTIQLNSANGQIVEITQLPANSPQMRSLRGGEIGMIFQEPMSSLTPVYSAGVPIGEAVRLHLTPLRRVSGQMEQNIQASRGVGKAEAREIAIDLLGRVGIPQPEQRVDSFPHQLSGGQRQRVMIAVALSCNPSLLIADEPTTALDVTTQAQINDLMRDLQAEFGMSIIYITHDLGVIAEVADQVAVMYLGRIVEQADVDTIFHNPKHPYTRALLHSIPKLGQGQQARLATIEGVVPSPFDIPPGCPFSDRCPEFKAGVCDQAVPALQPVAANQSVACFLHHNQAEETAV
ncbi:MAG: ABC transporter ATP-binding protein [Chloroflexota bacterium]